MESESFEGLSPEEMSKKLQYEPPTINVFLMGNINGGDPMIVNESDGGVLVES